MKRLIAVGVVVLIAANAFAHPPQDRNFIDGMIMHHGHGIEMARLAVQKAQHQELREMAQKMVDDQQKEIAEFEAMRDRTVEKDRPELADMPGMSGMDMSWLEEKSGNAFDIAFLTAMSEHHMGAIKMSQEQINRGTHAEAKRMARMIASKQRRERQTMLSWKREWM